jgi:hypothetical protein
MILAVAGYFGFEVAEPYWRYYRYLDTMQQAARFAETLTDEEISLKMHAKADSLGLPPAAYRLRFNRTDRAITIWADYYEIITLPRYTKEIHFQPRAEAPL